MGGYVASEREGHKGYEIMSTTILVLIIVVLFISSFICGFVGYVFGLDSARREKDIYRIFKK